MNSLSFYLPDAGEDVPVVRADDMGEGTWLLTEMLEDDDTGTERVCLTSAQIGYLYARDRERYGLQAQARRLLPA